MRQVTVPRSLRDQHRQQNRKALVRRSNEARPLVYRESDPMKETLPRFALTPPVAWLAVSLVLLVIHLDPGVPIQVMLGIGTGFFTNAGRSIYFAVTPTPLPPIF
jgi:hypothetical protein